ncbi:MAG TPA: MFS transporter [Anaerolineales bacterium]|nr:MFS transporter [Anaerolineales bacterium]
MTHPRRTPFWAILTANAISQMGNQMALVAIPWFVLQTTGSALSTSLVLVFTALPMVIAFFIGGALVDRFGARPMSVLADALSFVSVAAIPILFALGWLSLPVLLALVAFGALLDAPGNTARDALMPDLIERSGYTPQRANALTVGVMRVAVLAGPMIGGLLAALVGVTTVLWVNAATFVFSAAIVALAVPGGKPVAQGGGLSGSEFTAGLRHIWQDRVLRGLFMMQIANELLGDALVLVGLPVLASLIAGQATDLGMMMSAFGLGALAGVTAYGLWHKRFDPVSILGAGFLLVAGGVTGLVLTLLSGVGLAGALIAALLFGLGIGPLRPLLATVYQQRTPAALRGRVFGARGAFTTLAVPVGALLVGSAIDQLGLAATLGVISGSFGVIALLVVLTPSLRSLDLRAPVAEPAGD